jgi:hypothetical protein
MQWRSISIKDENANDTSSNSDVVLNSSPTSSETPTLQRSFEIESSKSGAADFDASFVHEVKSRTILNASLFCQVFYIV